MTNQVLSLLSRLLPRIRDVVGIELGASGTRAVRLHVGRGSEVAVTAAELLPPVEPPTADTAGGTDPLRLSKALQAWSAAVAYAFPDAIIKQLSLPAEKVESTKYGELLGVPRESDLRIAYHAFKGNGEADTPVVAVAVAPQKIEWIKELLPPGKPSLGVVEIAGLAVLAAYQRACVDPAEPHCDLVVDTSEHVTTLAICYRGQPLVLRTFPQGTGAVVGQIVTDLGVQTGTAREILSESSIDIRSTLQSVFEGLLRQLRIAVDFAAHRAGRRVERLFISGSLARSHDFARELQQQVGLQPATWSPWQGMIVKPNALAKLPAGAEESFHAATGVALGLLESD